jgi:hypothetical protein
MPVLPSSSSPVIIPNSSGFPGGTFPQSSMPSLTSQNIFETLLQEGRSAIFQNPVGGVINGLETNISSIYDVVTNSGCLSGGEKATLHNAIGTGGVGGLSQQLSLFSTHTQILSGLIPQGTNPTPGLDRILSVGRSLGNLSGAVDGTSECFSLLNNMTGLFSEELLSGYGSQIASMIEQINSCLADVTEIAYRLNEMVTTLQNIIDADNNFFQQALDKLIQASLSSLLESMYQNPCGKLLLESKIGQQKLLGLLNK